jgi:hypothetical protein
MHETGWTREYFVAFIIRTSTLPGHLSSPRVFSGVRVTRSLVLCVCFVDRCLSFCTFSFGHCVVCPSSIYGFWLPLSYFQTLVITWSLSFMENGNLPWYPSMNYPRAWLALCTICNTLTSKPMQSVPITTDVMGSNFDQGEVYSVMW